MNLGKKTLGQETCLFKLPWFINRTLLQQFWSFFAVYSVKTVPKFVITILAPYQNVPRPLLPRDSYRQIVEGKVFDFSSFLHFSTTHLADIFYLASQSFVLNSLQHLFYSFSELIYTPYSKMAAILVFFCLLAN